jgi:hypothetical protein
MLQQRLISEFKFTIRLHMLKTQAILTSVSLKTDISYCSLRLQSTIKLLLTINMSSKKKTVSAAITASFWRWTFF